MVQSFKLAHLSTLPTSSKRPHVLKRPNRLAAKRLGATRLDMLSLAISALLLTSIPLTNANAATIGNTTIASAQHETIAASIDVSNIDADHFSVAIAPKTVYQQMNMSAAIPLTVRFVKTSASTGKIVLSSAQPVSDPFADVVLTVNDKGRQQTVPKTLLLPLATSSQNRKASSKTLGTTAKPNLPEVTVAVVPKPIGTPLPVRKKAPPPLLVKPAVAATVPSRALVQPVPQSVPQSISVDNNLGIPTPEQQPTTAASRPSLNLAAKPQIATATIAPMSAPMPMSTPVLTSPTLSTANPSASASTPKPSLPKPSLLIQPIPDSVQPIIVQPSSANQPSLADQPNKPIFERLAIGQASSVQPNPTQSTMGLKDAASLTSATAQSVSPSATDPVVAAQPSVADNQAAAMSASGEPNAPELTALAAESVPSTSAMNTQLDILSTTITRRYSLPEPTAKPDNLTGAGSNITASSSAAETASTRNPLTQAQANEVAKLPTEQDPALMEAQTAGAAADVGTSPTKPTRPSQAKAPPNPAAGNNTAATSTSPTSSAIPLGEATYTVQKNDNLWTIAQQIASKNNMQVNDVMQQIQTYNPDAFINGEKSKLLANVELALPAYEVIPSKLGISAARQARQAAIQASKATKPVSRQPAGTQQVANKPNSAKPSSKQQADTAAAKRGASKPAAPHSNTASAAAKPTPQSPRLKLVTPGQNGQATGTGTTATTQPKQNGGNSALVSTLKTSRQKTAAQVQRVSSLNEKLAQRTHTLQLHNQRLATLEQRLKELRGQ